MSQLQARLTPHENCYATKDELLIAMNNQVLMDCPICLDYGIKCRVGAHPIGARIAPGGNFSYPYPIVYLVFPIRLFPWSTLSDEIKLCSLIDVATKADIRLIESELRSLKPKHHSRLPRSASETSTAVTPAEPALVGEGHAVVNAGIVDNALSHSMEGVLKDVREYYGRLRDHIHTFGGTSYQVVIRKKKDVVIKHDPFESGLQEVVFPYTSVCVKNHWIAFCSFNYNCGAYFHWALSENLAEGREGEETPPSLIADIEER